MENITSMVKSFSSNWREEKKFSTTTKKIQKISRRGSSTKNIANVGTLIDTSEQLELVYPKSADVSFKYNWKIFDLKNKVRHNIKETIF